VRKKYILCISYFFFLSSSLLTGCGWSKELNDRTFATAIFVDQAKTPDLVEVTITSLLPNRIATMPQSLGQQGKSYTSVSKTAKTIPEAITKIQLDLTRKISWGHTEAIVIGKKYATDKGLNEFFDWASREPTFLLNTTVFVAPSKAKDIVSLTPVYEYAPAEVLNK
jgi:spore germination protein KC